MKAPRCLALLHSGWNLGDTSTWTELLPCTSQSRASKMQESFRKAEKRLGEVEWYDIINVVMLHTDELNQVQGEFSLTLTQEDIPEILRKWTHPKDVYEPPRDPIQLRAFLILWTRVDPQVREVCIRCKYKEGHMGWPKQPEGTCKVKTFDSWSFDYAFTAWGVVIGKFR